MKDTKEASKAATTKKMDTADPAPVVRAHHERVKLKSSWTLAKCQSFARRISRPGDAMKIIVAFSLVGILIIAGCRSRVQPESSIASKDGRNESKLFSKQDVLDLRLKAPFKKLFDENMTHKTKYLQAPPNLKDMVVDGKLAHLKGSGNEKFDVRLRVRGNTSRYDCPFPKLLVEIRDATRGTAFEGSPTIRVGTHCGDAGDLPPSNYGRIFDDRGPWREAGVYRLLETMGILAKKTRVAEITYIDDETKVERRRKAFLIEDDDEFEARAHGKLLDLDSGAYSVPLNTMDPAYVARIFLAEILLDNSDLIFPLEELTAEKNVVWARGFSIWNFEILREKSGRETLVPQDFDLAGLVKSTILQTSAIGAVLATLFTDEDPHLLSIIGDTVKLRSQVSKDAFESARQEFARRAKEINVVAASLPLDVDAAANFKLRVSLFLQALASPILPAIEIAKDSVPAFQDSELAHPTCTIAGGSMVHIAERQSARVRVHMVEGYCVPEQVPSSQGVQGQPALAQSPTSPPSGSQSPPSIWVDRSLLEASIAGRGVMGNPVNGP